MVRWVRLDLRAQPFDVDVERLGVADIVAAPDAVDELHPGEHAAAVAGATAQQLELLSGNAAATPLTVTVCRSTSIRTGPPPRTWDDLLGSDPPQDGLDPGEQLAGGVRLGHVVVGTDSQPDDLVDPLSWP